MSSGIDFKQVTRAWVKLRDISHIGPIRNEADYEERVALLNELIDIVRDDEAHPLASLLEIVGELVEHYEDDHYPIPKMAPNEVLQYLLEEHGLKQSDLSDIGSQGVISELVAGKRSVNARQAKALAARFKVSPAIFL